MTHRGPFQPLPFCDSVRFQVETPACQMGKAQPSFSVSGLSLPCISPRLFPAWWFHLVFLEATVKASL